MRNDKDKLIVDLNYKSSLEIIGFTERLESVGKYNMANQLFDSGISIGANVREAQNSESKYDFIHKLKIAAKEGEGTEYWLMLCRDSKDYPNPEGLPDNIASINLVLSKIISASKSNNKQSSNRQIFKSSN